LPVSFGDLSLGEEVAEPYAVSPYSP